MLIGGGDQKPCTPFRVKRLGMISDSAVSGIWSITVVAGCPGLLTTTPVGETGMFEPKATFAATSRKNVPLEPVTARYTFIEGGGSALLICSVGMKGPGLTWV